MTQRTNEQIAMRVSWNTLIVNAALSAFKLFAGIHANSAAMLSDSAHSLSDVLSTVIVMIGVKLANKKSDKEHPYGHERLECVAAIILAALLFATGLSIGWSGVARIIAGNYRELSIPGTLALVAAVVSVAVKELMYRYTHTAAEKTGFGAMMADAWHHRSDALSSVGSFAGILGARLGLPVLDSVACVVICLFIVKAALEVFINSVDKLTDRACDDKTIEEICKVVLEQNAVLGIDQIKTRIFGNRIYMDVEISADGDSTLNEAHETAQRIHDAIESRFPNVKHCMVHMNPAKK